MKIAPLAAKILFLTTPVMAQDPGGSYSIDGIYLTGEKFTGEVLILFSGAWNCQYLRTTDTASISGPCLRRGQSLAVSLPTAEGLFMAVYDIAPSGALEGTWLFEPSARDRDIFDAGEEVLHPR